MAQDKWRRNGQEAVGGADTLTAEQRSEGVTAVTVDLLNFAISALDAM
jgi:hypothetical protein